MSATEIDLTRIQEIEKSHQPSLYVKRDIALVRGEGAYLFDSDGRRYLDAMSNYGVAVLGHADPEYAEALADQLRTLATGHQSFYNDVRAELLETLTTIAPAGLTRSFLTNSGAEAIEVALKFARVATGRNKIVAARHAYHGRTLGALAATADPKYRAPFAPFALETTHVPLDDAAALDAAIDDQTAAVILEPIQGEAGIYPASADYLQAARRMTADRGALLIVDEIQTGFRTGAPFAITAAGVTPDLLCTAKGMANGFPIGLTMLTESINAAIPGGAHGTTFGANPLACRAALVTVRALQARDLYARSAALGAEIIERIEALRSPKIRAVRGRGFMIGIELKERVTPTLRGLQQRGVLALPSSATTLRLLPPLIWEAAQVDELLAGLEATLA
jgi:[amino-group carrier protein]-gamma-(L-lysyl/L-ornithyl)-L-glutamate aminotransferase